MKKIIKTTILAFLLISLGSCEDDNNNPVAKPNGFELRSTNTIVSPLALTSDNDNDIVASLEWDKSDNGVQAGTAGITYRIEVSESNSNSNSVLGNEGNPITIINDLRAYTLKAKELNQLINKLGNFKCGELMAVDIRIKSTLGKDANAFSQYSNPIKIQVSGYLTEKQILSFAKTSSDIGLAPTIILSSSFDKKNDYEGYKYLEAGNYKFYQPDPCGSFASPTVYGGSAGVLTQGNSAAAINVSVSGYYLVKADLTSGSLSYLIQAYKSIGIFGNAVKSVGFVNAVPMSSVNNENIWTITIELFKGRTFRFKSNDYTGALTGNPPSVPGGAGTTTPSTLGGVRGTLQLVGVTGTAGDITVPGTFDNTKQSYTITVNVSNPRNYTYTLTPN